MSANHRKITITFEQGEFTFELEKISQEWEVLQEVNFKISSLQGVKSIVIGEKENESYPYLLESTIELLKIITIKNVLLNNGNLLIKINQDKVLIYMDEISVINLEEVFKSEIKFVVLKKEF